VPPKEPLLPHIVRHLLEDFDLVEALRNEHSLNHSGAWQWVGVEIMRATRRHGLDRIQDRALDNDDFVQVVQVEIARSLTRFRFESSLRTWLQNVTLRRLRRLHRDARAARRRAQVPADLEEVDTLQHVDWSSFEDRTFARELMQEILAILQTQPDWRLAEIFVNSVVQNWSTADIARRLELHPSRIRALMQRARQILSNDGTIRGFLADSEGG